MKQEQKAMSLTFSGGSLVTRSDFYELRASPHYASVPVETVDEIAASVRRIEARLAPSPALLTRKAFAKALGVSRNKTLAEILERYKVRTVKVMGALRIPASELERIQREGEPRPTAKLKTRTGSTKAPLAKDEIAALKARPSCGGGAAFLSRQAAARP